MEAVLALLKYPWKWDLKQESDKSDDQSSEAQRTKQSALSSTSSDLVICSSQAVKDFLRDGASGKKREKEKEKKKKNPHLPMQEIWETQVWFLGREDPLKEGMATHSSILAWRNPWTEEPGGLQSRGSPRTGHDWSNSARMHAEQKVYKANWNEGHMGTTSFLLALIFYPQLLSSFFH